jgi:ABC-type branched-chain amino acid transport systems, ATPase component
MKEKLLEASGVCMYFGGVHAVEEMDISLERDEILGIIGPNGSGKSTLVNVLTGIYRPVKGKIELNGQDITGEKPHKIAALGVARTFQNLRVFKAMTVSENVITGEHMILKSKFVDSLLHTRRYKDSERRARAKADELLEIVGLGKMGNSYANSMSYGQQKRLEIARALASDPKLCLFDEPAAGMNSAEALEMMETIIRVQKEQKIGVILIEHNMEVMMNTAHRIIVMDTGRKIAEGTPKEIQNNPKVIQVYLGEDD